MRRGFRNKEGHGKERGFAYGAPTEFTLKCFITHSRVEITRSNQGFAQCRGAFCPQWQTHSAPFLGTMLADLTKEGDSSFQCEAASLLEVSFYAELKFAFL